MIESVCDHHDALVEEWRTLYAKTLPSLAYSKDAAQPKWPVSLDHCFARIILDNTIGTGRGKDGENVQWDSVIRKPAVKHMSDAQLRLAIELAHKIQRGEANLVELDRRSLEARGKNEGKYGGKSNDATSTKKRKKDDFKPGQQRSPKKKVKQEDEKKQSTLRFERSGSGNAQLPSPDTSKGNAAEEAVPIKNDDAVQDRPTSQLEKELNTTSRLTSEQYKAILKRIQSHQGLTPFRRRLYICLLSVPQGTYTNYAAMAKHLNSVARAVGNGMRNNPFAPDVPCHRVLASDGTIGGFCGEWGRDGKLMGKQNEKLQLLAREGVKFDSAGRVKGPVFKDFWNFEDFEKQYGKIE